MEVYAQKDDFVLIKIGDVGVFPFGFIVNFIEKEVTSDLLNLYTVLKRGDWHKPTIWKKEQDKIILLIKDYIKEG